MPSCILLLKKDKEVNMEGSIAFFGGLLIVTLALCTIALATVSTIAIVLYLWRQYVGKKLQ